jgi:predicted DNA-binding transcriptional regulator AlpA
MSIEHAPERDAPVARKLIKKRELLEIIPLSFPTIWELIRREKFSKPVALGDGPNAPRAWFLDEIADYQENLKRAEYKPLTEAENSAQANEESGVNRDEPEREDAQPP